MKVLLKFIISLSLVSALTPSCDEERLQTEGSLPSHLTLAPGRDHYLAPARGYSLTSSMGADPTLAGAGHSAINNYMKTVGFEFSKHPNCAGQILKANGYMYARK